MTSEPPLPFDTMASDGDLDRTRTHLMSSQEPPTEETIQDLLTTAAKFSQLEEIEFLLSQYPSVPLNEEIVRAAVNTGSVLVFETLLARDPSVVNMRFDRRGTPLTVACMGRQKVEYLRFLLEAGADPNQDPDAASFPLALVAALYTDTTAIDLLLQHGAKLEKSGALTAAAFVGNEPMIHRLLYHGACLDADAPSLGNPKPVLHIAVRTGHIGVVRILLQHGADPNVSDASGVTAIDLAKQMSLKGPDMSEMVNLLEDEQRS